MGKFYGIPNLNQSSSKIETEYSHITRKTITAILDDELFKSGAKKTLTTASG